MHCARILLAVSILRGKRSNPKLSFFAFLYSDLTTYNMITSSKSVNNSVRRFDYSPLLIKRKIKPIVLIHALFPLLLLNKNNYHTCFINFNLIFIKLASQSVK